MLQLGKYQMSNSFSYAGPVDVISKNHIAAIYKQNPQKAANYMIQLQAFRFGQNTESILSKFGEKQFDTEDEYTWDVMGSSERNIPLVAAYNEDGTQVTSAMTTAVGANAQEFQLVFDEAWFAKGETIIGEKDQYIFWIKREPVIEGTHYVYTVELMGAEYGVPATELLPGRRFSVESAPVERDLSRKAGGIRWASSAAMRNDFSKVRAYAKVSGSMYDQYIACGLPIAVKDNSKKGYHVETQNKVMNLVDWKVENQFRQYKNNILLNGRSNRNRNGEYMNVGESGNVIKVGAGLKEQMEFANTMYYPTNAFSIKLLEDALYDLSAGKKDFSERTFVVHTGERGAILFNKAVKDTMSGWYPVNMSTQANLGQTAGEIKKVSSELHENALAFVGGQFTEFYAPNGLHIKLVIDKDKDDEVKYKIQHPMGGPAESYRFDIYDLGSSEQQNIFKCTVKNRPESRGYLAGMINPFLGTTSNNYMATDEDSAEVHRMATLGVCVLDPTATMSLIPNILQ